MKNLWTGGGCRRCSSAVPAASTSPRNTRPMTRRFGKSTSRSSMPCRATGSRCTLASLHRTVSKPPTPPYILMHGFPRQPPSLRPPCAAAGQETPRDCLRFPRLGQLGQTGRPPLRRRQPEARSRGGDRPISVCGGSDWLVHDASGLPGIDYAIDNPDRTVELILLNTLYAPSGKRIMPPSIKRFSTLGLRRDLLIFAAPNEAIRCGETAMPNRSERFFADPAIPRPIPADLLASGTRHQAGILPA